MKMFILLLISATFIVSCQTAPGTTAAVSTPSITISETITYEVKQSISLSNGGPGQPEKHNLWVALISDHEPYQRVLSRTIQPGDYRLVSDEYGNQYAEFDLQDMQPGQSREIHIDYDIAVNEVIFDLAGCRGQLPEEFIEPELHIESNNPQIVALAEELVRADQDICEQVRAFYEYVGQNLVYTFNGDNWGAQAALGPMGADCTEYSSLLIALSRSQDIPARYVEGLLYLGGTQTVEAQQEHAWTEVYFPGSGWAPVDPTLGRSQLTRDSHFARYSANHIIVTEGRTPSTLRGASYWSHLYWPGESAQIDVQEATWTITPTSSSPVP